jgi:TonB family protein
MTRDPVHIRFAYSLAGAVQLPLTGDKHPLSIEAHRWVIWAGSVALFLGIGLFAGWRWYETREPELSGPREVVIVRYTELGVPPSINRPTTTQVSVAQAAPPLTIAVPEPVPDELAMNSSIMTQADIDLALAAVSQINLEGDGNVQVDVDLQQRPQEESFKEAAGPVNELPVRLTMDRPQYPEMARMAQIEGTVNLNVLVGTDGRVSKVEIVDGPAQLRQAAITAAKTAVFKPATMNKRPVKVWVAMPINFKLRGSAGA